MKKTNFTRTEIHSIYILYKALQETTSQLVTDYSKKKLIIFSTYNLDIDDGINYYTFRKGIYQIFVQSEEIAKKIFYTIDFNYSEYLNWEEFLNLMEIIKGKTLREKIDLFIRV